MKAENNTSPQKKASEIVNKRCPICGEKIRYWASACPTHAPTFCCIHQDTGINVEIAKNVFRTVTKKCTNEKSSFCGYECPIYAAKILNEETAKKICPEIEQDEYGSEDIFTIPTGGD